MAVAPGKDTRRCPGKPKTGTRVGKNYYSMYLKPSRKQWFIGLIIPFLLAACHVMLIGAYDQVTDECIQKIQVEVSTVLVKIAGNIDNNTPGENKYEKFKPTYDNIKGEIESLKIRSSALPKYKIVNQQVVALGATVLDLEKYHKLGFSKKQEVEEIKKIVEDEFKSMTILQNGLKRQKN